MKKDFTSMELAKKFFDNVGLPNRVSVVNDEKVLIVTFNHEGTPLDTILHREAVERKAEEFILGEV